MIRLKFLLPFLTLVLMLSGLAQKPALAQNAQGFTADTCAVSVDIWLLGESCILSGLKARYGEYLSVWAINDRDTGEYLGGVLMRQRLFPLIIASKPTDFGWIEVQPYIDFSMVDEIDTAQIEVDGTETSLFDFKTSGAVRTDLLVDTTTLLALNSQGYDIFNPRVRFIYQYFRLGYAVKTPWPFFKLTYGIGVGYHFLNYDFYFCNQGCGLRTSFFSANYEYFGIIKFLDLAVYEGESLNIMKFSLLSQDTVKIGNEDRSLSLDHIFAAVEVLSWSFHF